MILSTFVDLDSLLIYIDGQRKKINKSKQNNLYMQKPYAAYAITVVYFTGRRAEDEVEVSRITIFLKCLPLGLLSVEIFTDIVTRRSCRQFISLI